MATANKTKRRNFFFVAKWILAKQMKKVKPIVSFSLRIEEFFFEGGEAIMNCSNKLFSTLAFCCFNKRRKNFFKGRKGIFFTEAKMMIIIIGCPLNFWNNHHQTIDDYWLLMLLLEYIFSFFFTQKNNSLWEKNSFR